MASLVDALIAVRDEFAAIDPAATEAELKAGRERVKLAKQPIVLAYSRLIRSRVWTALTKPRDIQPALALVGE